MFKKLIKLSIILFLYTGYSYSETINNVEIFGNKRISEETILVLGNVNIGDDYSESNLNIILKDLYSTNFFENISIKLVNETLSIEVIENPIIEDIEFVGIKNKEFIEKLSESLTLKNRMSFTKTLLENDLRLIENILKANGYYFSKVSSSITENKEQNSVRLFLDIFQGEKAKIRKISFIGDKKIKDKKLLEVIASEEAKFWKFISNKVYLNQSTINLDKRLLENYYKNLGFYKVDVIDSFVEFNKKGYFKLVFNINAGEQHYFNDFKLNLPEDYKADDFNKVKKTFEKLKGKRFSLDDLDLILKEIDYIASSRLYDFIDANVEENIIEKNKINLTFNVEDSQKFYVEKINITGNYTTVEEVIRNKLIVDEGDPFNTLLFNKSIANIKSLGIFKKVSTNIEDSEKNKLKIININVEEQPTGEISLAAGVGTSGSTIGAGVTEKNFLGKGINLNTNIELSEDSLKGQFVYSKPNFAYTDNTLFTSIKSTSTDNLSEFGYKVTTAGFSVGTEFEQYENLFFSPEIDFQIEDLTTNSTASTNLRKQEGSYEDLYFNYGLNYDLRNSSYNASSGNITSFYQDLPLASQSKEISNTFLFTQYKKLSKKSEMIGKASIYLKAINSIDNTDVRISKRANVPYNRLRGFEKGKVGPVENNDYIGGNYVSALNLSTNIPTILNTVENIDFKYFIDFANVWGVDYDSSIDDSNEIRSATGIGIDFLSPLGPLSFSFTQPITKKSSDKTETFRFNLGTTF